MLEKMPTFGGNSVINGGEMTAVGAPQQKDAGIKDSLDLWMKDTVTAGLGLNQMDKAKELADNMMVCYEWLKNEMGVKFKPVITQDGGHSVPRSVVADNGSGSGFINPMHQKCEQAGVSLLAAELAEGSLAHDFPGNNCAVGLKVGHSFRELGAGHELGISFVGQHAATCLLSGNPEPVRDR